MEDEGVVDGIDDTKGKFERDKAESFAKLHQLNTRIDDSV